MNNVGFIPFTDFKLKFKILILAFFNERVSTVNRALDGSTYLGKKLVPSSLCEKKFSCEGIQQLILGIGNAI
jgi:hypothetical protein